MAEIFFASEESVAFSFHFPLDVLQLFSCSYCIYLGCNFGIFPTLMFHWALVMVQASSVGRIWGIVGCASLHTAQVLSK